MPDISRTTRIIAGITPDAIPFDELMADQSPVILAGLARDWPLVREGRVSARRAADYLKTFYQDKRVVGYTAAPDIRGRFFYNDDISGMNFTAERVALDEFLERILAMAGHPDAPSYYVGSTDLGIYLPGLNEANCLTLDHPMFAHNLLRSIWIGNRTTATCHYDMSHNMAVCVAGRRRFTLFPPAQVHNLYPGPLEPTPGGQVVSMVDFRQPDYDRYPRFRLAEAAGQVAEMEPGDVLFYPALWWHHVEALEDFNILVNYWWNTTPVYMDTPMNTLLHGLLSLRDRPDPEKQAWRDMFDYYVFGPADRAGEHLPEVARGNLAPMDEMKARRLRAMLLNKLNR
ncbi:transcription factor jumonji domain-containing protein [Asticcacaulis biprosthecium C19]|uniref:Transcription factor jumonji domain-containing protein n=1 Tax=Asticcacaulis biprosthecium C19 TaxID=715226 RepID=F4QLP3_9CAUL|nr:transcription factor jumonji domain-containing protein [Asticcacaulis biprosthecium C19]